VARALPAAGSREVDTASRAFSWLRRWAAISVLWALCCFIALPFHLAAQSNAPLTNFPTFNGNVSAIAISGTTMYVGGGFTQATNAPVNGGGTLTRNRLAAIDMTTGALLPWNPDANNNVAAIAVDGSTVYVGGGFTNVGGQPRSRIAALDAGTGAATTWNPGSGGTTSVNAIVVSGTTVYVGGMFTNIGGQPRNNIAAITAGTGVATAWNPNADADVTTLLVNGATVYAGGAFANIGGQPRNRIAALDAATGTATLWNPNSNNTVLCMALSGTTLYVGGDFTNIGGFGRIRIAALNTLVNTNNATAWNPTATGSVDGIAISGTTVYVCGAFANAGGFARNRIAGLDATVNTLNATAWDPNADAGASAIAVSGSNVFVGGAFLNVNATARACFAAFGPPPPPVVVPASLAPARNTNTATATAPINIVFDQAMNTGTYTAAKLVVHGNMRGKRTNGAYTTVPATTVNFPVTPARLPNEVVSVTVTNATSAAGVNNRPFVYQFRTAVTQGHGRFVAHTSLLGPSNQYGAAFADVDGDGDLDMACANYSNNSVSIYLNDGTGNFPTQAAGSPFTVGNGPWAPTFADLNSDGLVDMVVPCEGGANLHVRQNTGGGVFSTAFAGSPYAAAVFGVGNRPLSAAAADVDADGDLDLVVATDGNSAVLLNNGSGTFTAAPSSPYAGLSGFKMNVGDMDNDGDIDFVVANPSGSTVNVMLNSGNGSFSAASGSPFALGITTPQGVAVGDMNGDGNLDIVAARYGGGANVAVLLNNGTATMFTHAAGSPFTSGATFLRGVDIGDLDNDGDLDVVAAAYTCGANNAYVFLNNGSGGLTAAVGSPFACPGNAFPALGDIDNDGDLDAAIADLGCGGNRTYLLLNAPPPPVVVPASLAPARNTNTATATAPINIVFDQAMNTGTYTAAKLVVHGNMRGKRTNGAYTTVPATTVNFPVTPARLPNELVSVTVTNATSAAGVNNRPFVYQFRTAAGVGPGTFYPATNSPYAAGSQSWFAALGDVDGDGDLDIASSFSGGMGGFYIRLNNGTGDFTMQATGSPFTIANAQGLAFGDVDNDGDLDLAIVAAGNVHVRLNNGSGDFSAVAPGSPISVGAGARNVVFGDVNGDGILDIAVPCQTAGYVSILWGAGTGAFGGGATYSHSNAYCAALGDVDGDGDLDLVSGDVGAYNVNVRLNNGLGAFSAAVSYAMANSIPSVALADVDGDGDLDLGIASQFPTPQLVVRLNDGSGNFATSAPGSPYSATGSLYSIHFADVDGDNDLDAVLANYVGGSDVAVRLNNGSGNFTTSAVGSPFSAASGGAARFATVGDVDGDGDLDVVTANDIGNTVSVLANTLAMNVQNNIPPFGVPPVTPTFNTMNAPPATNITIPFSDNLIPATVNATNFRVHGLMRGLRTATYGVAPANTATLTGITASFRPNEQVFVSVTNAQSTGGASTRPFVMGFRTAAGAGPATFYETSAPSVGTWPRSVVTGDFDGDGDLDLAVANSASNNVSILLNTGTGVYSAAVNYLVGTQPASIACGDFDGDGDLDLATANLSSNNVSVLLNTGAGVYGAAVNYSVGLQPVSIACGDFDGDGDLDLAVARQSTNNVSILLNTGTGTYGAAMNYAVGTTPVSVACGDFDGDGDLDLATANQGSNNVSILFNTGTGTYGTAVNYGVGTGPSSVACGDFNGDGRLDLATANQGSNNASILFNTGAGTYGAAVNYGAGTNAYSVTSGDFDGDGDLDLAVANYVSHNVSVLLNTGAGVYGAAMNYSVGTTPTSITSGDFDGDGDLDLAVANLGNNNVSILKNGTQPLVSAVTPLRNGNGSGNPNIAGVSAPVTVNFSTNITTSTYSVPPAQQLFQVHGGFTGSRTRAQGFSPNGSYSGGAATMTFTPSANFRPGELVSVTVTNASSSVAAPNNSVGIRTRPFVFDYRVAAGVGPANFSVPSPGSPFGAGALARSVAFGDVDGDGDLDIATANQTGTNITVLANNGTGSYTAIAGSPFAVGGTVRSLVFGDVDGDGDLDLVITRLGANNVVVLLNNGSGSFTTTAPGSPFAVGTNPFIVALGDVDADGDLDLATANNGSNNVTVLLNNGAGSFTPAPGSPFAAGTGASGVDFGDVDGDGDLDLAVANNGANNVAVLLNNGAGSFTPALGSPFAVGAAPRSVTFADVNGDGNLDLATTNQTGNNVTVLLNDGAGSFSPAVGSPFAVGAEPISLAFGDVDGDGDLDLATANQNSANVTVLLNSGSGAFAPAANSPFAAGAQPNSVAFGDVDGDSDLDLAAANGGSNNVSVLLNQTAPATYYYQSGDAGLPANWNSLPWGGGTPATSFSSPATDFYVMGGGAVTTATVNTSFTLGANVSLHVTTPSVLAVANGVTITNNGFLNVSGATVAGATLRLNGMGAIAGNAVTYWGTTATLEYTGTVARSTSAVEFPGPMPGSVTINNTGGITLHANRQIDGTFTMQSGSLDISGRTLQPNGVINFNGGTINGNITAGLIITGSGNINGNALFGAGGIGSLTMNRMGVTMTLGSVLRLTAPSALNLVQGYVRASAANYVEVQDLSPGAITGGGSNSHVAGPLRRSLPTGGGTFSYPVGGGTTTTYLPVAINYASAGASTAYEVEPIMSASGGTESGVIGAGTLSTTEYWRTNVVSGSPLNTVTLTFTRTTPGLIASNRIGESATAGGTYQGINGNTFSTVAAPNISNTTPYASIATGTRFYAIGAAAAPPVVTAVSPTRNNPAVTPLTSPVNVTFSQTLTALGMRTWNGFTGSNAAAPTFAGSVGTQGSMNTRPGERVLTTVIPTGTSSMAGFMTTPHVFSFMGRAGVGPATFTEVSQAAVPSNVWSVQVGYFNNDANLDVAVSTGDSPTGSLRIFTGDGAGTFTPWYNATLSGGTPQGRGLAVADFNNDGRPDAAVCNILTGTVEIFLNSGGTTMTPGAVLPAFSAFDLTVSDFDGDGNLDIAATGYGGSQLFVYLGNGVGGFAAAPSSPYTIGFPNASGIRAEDVNNDGAMDIVLNTATALHAFTNNGAGLFTQTNIPTGYTALFGLFTADMDNDGDVDIVPVGFAPTMSVFQNNGAGVFTAVALPATPPVAANIGDFNGDGLIDIITNTNPATVPYVVQNTNTVAGTLSFAAPRVMPNPTLTGGGGAAGDVDNDGDLDIIGAGGGYFAFLRNAPFQHVVNNTFPFGVPPVTPAFNSMNALPATSIVVPFAQNVTAGTASANSFKVWGGFTGLRGASYATGGANATIVPAFPFRRGEHVWVTVTHAHSTVGIPTRPFVMGFRARAGTGPATFVETSTPGAGVQPHSVALGDVDGDGDLDLAVANFGGSNVSILLNAGTGVFGAATNYSAGVNPSSVVFGDMDNDGDLDLVVTNVSTNNVSILLNGGAGTFGAAANYAVGTSAEAAALGDFDGDGDLDLAVANRGSNNMSVLFNNGAGVFGAAVNYAAGAEPYAIASGDFDDDGDIDIALVQRVSNDVRIFLNNGLGVFVSASVPAVGTTPEAIAVGDFNGDGRLDLAVANTASNNLSVLLNTGAGTFGAAVNYSVGAFPRSVTAGDFDGDGDLDLAVGNRTDNTTSILLNAGTGSFTVSSTHNVGTFPYAITVGDVDGDGDMDVATANISSANVSVLFNQAPSVRSGFGQGMSFNGTVQDVTVTNAGFDIVAGTLEAWVRPTWVSGAPAGNPCVMGVRSSSALTRLSVHIRSNYAGLDLWNGSSVRFFAYPFVQNQWYHVAVVHDGTSVRLYINGRQVGSAVVYPLGPATGGVFHIGWSPGTFEPWIGELDEVRLWNVALPQPTINRYKGVELTSVHPQWGSLLGYWKLNEYSGGVASDASGNGNAGTVVGSPLRVVSGAPLSLIANPVIGVGTGVRLPSMPEMPPLAATGFSVVTPALRGVVTPVPGNPVVYTPTMVIGSGVGDSFVYQVSDGVTVASSAVSVGFEPRLTGGVQTVVPATPTALVVPDLSGGTPPYTWSWSPSVGLSATTVALPVVTTTVARTYTVTVQDALGFSHSAMVTVNVAANPMFVQPPTEPLQQAVSAERDGGITLRFADVLLSGTASVGATVQKVWGSMTGLRSATYSASGASLSTQPVQAFRAGEEVWLTVTNAQNTAMTATRPFTMSFRARAGVGPGLFQQVQDVGVRALPTALASADLDNNGTVDVLVAHAGSAEVLPLLNSGTGSLSAGVPVVLSSLSSALGTGDLDNDGDVDAVVVSASAMSMAVLVNNGAGVLTLGGVVVLPERATAVAVGDYDADGFLDVVIGLSSGEAVMARNNGAGGFVVGAVVALPSGNPSHAVAADFDNDGDTDVVISGLSSSPTNVSLLINNGLGVFAVEPLTVGSVPQRVAAGDMFGSGRADIVSVNSVSGTLTVLRNMGGLAFTTSTVSVCSEPTGVVLADVDGDRDMDMVVSCSMSGEVVVVRNDGGRFVVVRQPAGQEAAVGRLLPDGVLLRGSPRDVVSGDFDGDGDLDLATVNYTGNGVAVLRNQQLPQMSAVPNPVSFGVVDVGQTVELPVQINGSNLVDVVSVRASGDFGAMGFSLSSTPTLTFSTRASVVIGTTATAPASVAAQVYVRFSASSTAASFSTLAVLTRGGVGIVLPVIANAIVPPPTITTFSPSRAAGDATVLVTGTQYQWATRVLVGTTVASFSILSPTQIALVVPRSGFSSAPITVISPGGSATSVMPLVFIPLPEISHISTTIATVGTPIVISGSGLSNPSGVSIGGVPVLEFRVLNDGMIELIAPEAATTGTITIVGEGGVQSSAREITITPPPAIRVPMTTVVGSTGGTIILTGTNFTFVTGASIGGTTTTVRVLSPTQIAIIVPAGLSTTTETQRVELLAQGNGFSRAEIPFAYSSVPPPVITMLTTPTASTGGTVRLVGEHLAGATVFVGGVRAVVVQNTDGSVSFVMPSGLPPSTMGYAITVRTQGGEAASPRNIFPPPVAVPAPLITGLSPRVMEAGGVVVVSGGNFANVQNVFIGGFPVRYQIVSSTQIVITVPEALVVPTNVSINTGLSGRVTVVTSSGVGTSADVLNQPLPPVITAVGPSSGSPGDTVVLSGEHFRGLQAITFGGLPVQSWQQTSPTRVVVVLSSMATRMTNAPIVAVGPGGSTTASVQFRFSVSLERDSLALRALYEATGGVFWRERRGWSAADVPVEQWHGVTVEQNRIVRLVLPSNALRDTLPSALGALSGLRELDLSDNNLTGVLPDSLRLLGKLEVVRLARNRFRGGVGVMCSWPNARILDFSRNELGGPIPRCIGLLTAMEYFDVSQNAFVEDIPVEMVNLSRLEVMLLGQNQLSGGLPAEFGLDTVVSVRSDAPRGMSGKHSTARVQTLGALRVMDVSNNQLTGTLPATLGNITSLRSLVLQNNRFTGVVPVEFAQLRNLRRLELSRNRLTLVPDLRGIPRLDTLRLEHNRLDFASIEPNLGVGEFFYAPQDTLGVGVDTTVMLGSTVRLARFAGGAANEYQWYKARWSVNAGGMSSGVSGSSASSGLVWVPVAVGNRSVLALEAFSLSDTGTYECRITNTEARALTLYTRPITLRARSEAAPAQPELRLPINTAVYVPPRPRFVWRRQPEASSYVVQVSSEPSFTTLITSATIGATMGAVFGTTADAVSDSVRWRMPSGGRLLERNRRYWWRVQARNEHGASAWSAVWSFTTAPEGVDVVLSSVEFGRLPVGDTARARGGGRISGELVNISGKALTVRSIAALDAAQFQTQDDLRSLVLLDDEVEFPVVLWFTPRRVGRQVSGVAIDYSVGTTQQAVAAGQSLPDKTGKTEKTAPTLQTTPQTALLGDSVLRGTGTALKALTVNFGVVRSTRRTLTAGLLINRGQQEVTVRQVRVRNDGLLHGTLNGAFTGAFTGTAGGVVSTSGTSIGGNATIPFRAEQLEAAGEPMILGAGDTSAVILWCAPPQDGLWEGAVEYIADGDTARASILALARAPRAEDVTLTPFVVAARSSAVAGDTVPVGIGFEESRSAQARARLFTAVIPRVRVMVSFSKAVLALPANEVRAVAMRTSSPRTRTTILATAPVLWNGRDTTLVDFHTLAVLGDTERTTLKLLSVEWGTLSEGSGVLTAGTLGNQSAMQPAARTIQVGGLSFVEKAVFVELPENPHAEVALAACVDSLTGTVRLLHGTRTTTLAHSPNPASDALKVLYTLRESGIITLTLIDMHGRTVKTLASGYHQAGVYELSLPTDDLPSAVYTLRLITQTEHRASTLRLMR
jgi:hypothetical protein